MWNLYYLYLSIVVHLRLIGSPDIELRWLSFNLRPHFLLVSTHIRGLLTDLDVNCNSGTLRSFAFGETVRKVLTGSEHEVNEFMFWKCQKWNDADSLTVMPVSSRTDLKRITCFSLTALVLPLSTLRCETVFLLSANETQLCDAFPRMPHQRVLVRRWPLLFGPDGIWGFF